MASFASSSDTIVQTEVHWKDDPREFYLRSYQSSEPPVISHSTFVPRVLVQHLLRNKKNSALGAKYVRGRWDAITNMEGALHTYVTPLAPIYMHGDYRYARGHGVVAFPAWGGKQGARVVVLSALIQLDCEDEKVMVQLSRLGAKPMEGLSLPDTFRPPTIEDKQDEKIRLQYDLALKRHIIAHLISSRILPSFNDVTPVSVRYAETYLSQAIEDASVRRATVGSFVRIESGRILSLELFLNTVLESSRNEFRALERLCKHGYVYTFDPPSIFAREVSPTLLNRLQLGALQLLAAETPLTRMRAYAFNDYADPAALELLRLALSERPHVDIMSKAALFGADGHYAPPLSCRGAILVIHNNSDGFGQNIETEPAYGSMDGTIGAYSSAAASLHRQHPRLLDNIFSD
ncbi:unnamed protein product [Peniophora sp. CBMAI 1063]|nr:unnamed protein product [Peniophora sp. CBMAI 1063]